jgi:hypothetical protein
MSFAFYIYDPLISIEDIKLKTSIHIDTDSNGVLRFSKSCSYGFPFFREDGSLHYIVFKYGTIASLIIQELYDAFAIKLMDEEQLIDYSYGEHGDDFWAFLVKCTDKIFPEDKRHD